MSAVVVATGFGGPEVLSVIDEPTRDPGPAEVAIAVRAAGVNPIDYKSYSGALGADPNSLPIRLGYEAAGVVTSVGAGVVDVAVGDHVIAYPAAGAYAAELIIPSGATVPKPDTMSWEQAGGLMVTGVTATHTIEAVGLRAGETVLIHGAAGGVGLIAIQLAVARGAAVIATARPAIHDLLRDLGATPVAYGDGLADRVRVLAPSGVDAALDLVGTDEAVDVSVELVEDRHRIASIVAFGRGPELGIQLLGGGPGADAGTEIRNAARRQLTAAFADGNLQVLVARSFPLTQVAEAHRHISAGHTNGKTVLVP